MKKAIVGLVVLIGFTSVVLAQSEAESNEKGIVQAYYAIENGVVSGYKTIENSIVSGYKGVENIFVSGYKAVEDKFVAAFLTPKNDSTIEQNQPSEF
jgi:hypothetical protein